MWNSTINMWLIYYESTNQNSQFNFRLFKLFSIPECHSRTLESKYKNSYGKSENLHTQNQNHSESRQLLDCQRQVPLNQPALNTNQLHPCGIRIQLRRNEEKLQKLKFHRIKIILKEFLFEPSKKQNFIRKLKMEISNTVNQ